MGGETDKDLYFAVWTTAWGPMGAVAGRRGLRRVVLPHYESRDLVELLGWEHPGARQDRGPFERLMELAREYFNGSDVVDFKSIECDLPGLASFSGMVYRACREIPYGRTIIYSSLARMIGRDDAARAVATAMSKNPVPLVVPCHRVVRSDGGAGGFSAAGGESLKRRMLDLEGRVCRGRG